MRAEAGTARRIEAGSAAVAASIAYLRGHFGRVTSEWKQDGSRVTAADLEITRQILGSIGRAFPEDQCFSEESDPGQGEIALQAEYAWVLDPIDGTNNYALGIPSCAVSLGLVRAGEPVYGWVYDYARDCMLRGGPGYGVWDGDRPAGLQTDPLGPQSVIGINAPFDSARIPELLGVLRRHKIRCLGSSTLHLAYAATGLFAGALDHNVKVWDIAAATALMRAAGGEVRTLDRQVFPMRTFSVSMKRIRFVAGSPAVCDSLAAAMAAG